jgi:hypothetical protein
VHNRATTSGRCPIFTDTPGTGKSNPATRRDAMQKILETAAIVTGLLGAIICLVAGIYRITGSFHLANFESMSLFVGGMGLMVFSALLKLQLIHGTLKRSC